MPITISLSKPLKVVQGDVMELKLRDMAARDLVLMRKPPYSIVSLPDGGTRIDQDHDACMKMLATLSGVDEISLGALSVKDYASCCDALARLMNGDDVKN